ncbi:MAG: BON domain-containing protein [Chloroflexota bacterium]|nr:BON domain-containing protein [Chloroflexota bacterium]
MTERIPLPSEDTGDLVDEPASGQTDDYLVAREEGLTYDPPGQRVPGESQPGDDRLVMAETARPADDELLDRVLDALRSSDVPAGERLRIAVAGRTVSVRGEVESIDVLDELLGMVGDVPGVDEVIDEVEIAGV